MLKTEVTLDELENGSIFHQIYETKNNEEKIKKLFLKYSGKRAANNYTEESISALISENRFSEGIVETYFNSKLVDFCGLANYNNWIVVSRYVRLRYLTIPFFLGSTLPMLLDIAKERNLNGIILTFNEYNQIFKSYVEDDFESKNKKVLEYHLSSHKIYDVERNMRNIMKVIDNPVMYNYTKQWVLYFPIKDCVPDFPSVDSKQSC